MFSFAKNDVSVKKMSSRVGQDGPYVRNFLEGFECLREPERIFSIEDMWNVVIYANYVKGVVYYRKICLSKCRWEKRLLEFINAAQEISECVNVAAECAIYMMVTSYSKALYIGETEKGFNGRFKSHILALLYYGKTTASNIRMQLVYEHLGKFGLRRCVFLPLYMWKTNVRKTVRMELDLFFFVAIKRSKLNVTGQEEVRLEKTHEVAYYLPRKRKFRLVIRLVKWERSRKEASVLSAVGNRRQTFKEAFRERGKSVKLVSRLARRPFKDDKGDDAASQPKTLTLRVQSMSRWAVAGLYRLGGNSLYGASRSIFMKNLSTCMKGRTDIAYTSCVQTSALFTLPGTVKYVRRVVQDWLHRAARFGAVLTLRFRLSSGRGKTVLEHFENTTSSSMKTKQGLVCTCGSFSSEFRKVEGHVCMPLTHYLENRGLSLPKGWTIRTKLVPVFEDLKKQVSSKLDTMVQAVKRRLISAGKVAEFVCLPALDIFANDRIRVRWEKFTSCMHWYDFEERAMSLKDEVKTLVWTTLDKCKTEAMLVCASKWGEAVTGLAQDFRELSDHEYSALLDRFFKAVGGRGLCIVISGEPRSIASGQCAHG